VILAPYPEPYCEFCRLKKLGVELSHKLLKMVARTMLAKSKHDLLGIVPFQIGKDGEKELLPTKVTARWIQSFEEKHQIVLRK
jgi:hypothetical protein